MSYFPNLSVRVSRSNPLKVIIHPSPTDRGVSLVLDFEEEDAKVKYRNTLLKLDVCLITFLAVNGNSFGQSARQKKAKEPDFHFSVFALGTYHILTEDVAHWGTAFLVDNEGTMVTAERRLLEPPLNSSGPFRFSIKNYQAGAAAQRQGPDG
jgi:hypothetical protein